MKRIKYLFRNLFILLFITLFITSCNYKDVQLKKIESFKVLNFDKEGAEVELNLLVDNKNKIGFTVYSSDLNLTISKIELGKVTFAEKVHIPGGGECHKRVVLKASLKDLGVTALASLASLALTKQVDLSINGDVKVRSMLFFSKRYPVNLKEKIKL
jgi:LEA14-like dessication related protein